MTLDEVIDGLAHVDVTAPDGLTPEQQRLDEHYRSAGEAQHYGEPITALERAHLAQGMRDPSAPLTAVERAVLAGLRAPAVLAPRHVPVRPAGRARASRRRPASRSAAVASAGDAPPPEPPRAPRREHAAAVGGVA